MNTAMYDVAADATPLCPACMQSIEPDVDLCPHCNAPLYPLFILSPYRQGIGQGFVYLRAIARPTSPLILFGALAIFGGFFLSGVAMLALQFTTTERESPWDTIGTSLFALVWLVVGGTGILKTLRNYARLRLEPPIDESTNEADTREQE